MPRADRARTPRRRAHPSVAPEQAETVKLLADPATHGVETVERVDTHISHLFLAGDRAYKLKRALRTNFLDFTTVAKREEACRREIEVNAAVASGIYRGVVAVTREGPSLRLDGAGKVVDWVVEMTRFDRAEEFDALAEAGGLDRGLVEALADVVAEMHAKAPKTPDCGGAARVGATIRQISEAIADSPVAGDLADLLDAWRGRAEAALAATAARLDARRRHGCVRRCHGDLHLGNICMFEGRPTPFDALEFNEEMASTDVLYDVAFTVMDLLERDLRPLANAFLNRYLSATRDYSGLALLPLFVSMRAAVRALVAAMRPVSDPREPSAAERLRFAVDSLAEPPPPRLIAIGGLSGAGKSTVARLVAPDLGPASGAAHIRSDVSRKRLWGVAPEDRLPEEAYAPEVSARVYARIGKDARRALRAGVPAILDATHMAAADRDRAERLAAAAGVPFTGVWLACGAEELRRRVRGREADASDADLAVLERQLASDPGPGDWIEISGEGAPEDIAAALRRTLEDAAPAVAARGAR